MIDKLKKYEKAWALFEDWYYENFKIKHVVTTMWYILKDLPFEMQQGVFLRFLDEQGLYVHIAVYTRSQFSFEISNNETYYIVTGETGIVETRTEALQSAIIKAFEILNQSKEDKQ